MLQPELAVRKFVDVLTYGFTDKRIRNIPIVSPIKPN